MIGLHAWLFMRDPALYRSSGNWAGQLLAAALVMFPQLLYWHFVHGSWVVYSYGDEGFTQWRTPHVVEFLFAVQNGCLPYAPALLLLPWSIPALWRVDKRVAIMCLLVLVVIVYGCASWYTWQYGCSYGARPMVQYMPLIAIPIWSFLARTDHRSFHWRLAILPVMALLCFLNYRAMLQYGECIDGDEIWNWRIYLENIMNAFL